MKTNLWKANNTNPKESNIYREYFLNMSHKNIKVKNFLVEKTSIWKYLEAWKFRTIAKGHGLGYNGKKSK